MSRETSHRKQIARSLAKYGWEPMRSIKRGEKGLAWPSWATRIYQNNRYTALVNDCAKTTKGLASLAYITPHHAGREVFWRDLQRIKTEIFGARSLGVQYFPREEEVVDFVNVYWLFVYPEGVLPEPILESSPRS